MRIDRVDPESERDLAGAAAIETAYWHEVLGSEEPATTIGTVQEQLRLGRDDASVVLLLARDADEAIGLAAVELWTGYGNEHSAHLEDLYVLRDHRRRGAGRALLDETIGIVRTAGRSLVLGAYNDGNEDGAAFAAAVGARIANTGRQNRVAVADLDRAQLETWNNAPEGYSLVQFDDRCPDALVDQYVRMQQVMNDAPRTKSLDDFLFTSEHRRTWEAYHESMGITTWFVGARHDATGDLAGFSEMSFRTYKPWLVEQEDTGVDAPHRGHRIGWWLKAVNALRVLDEKPEARFIQTWNDGTNRWMLDINTAMGFAPVASWIEAELDI